MALKIGTNQSEKSKFPVTYLTKEPKQHDFSKDRALVQHIAQLCKGYDIQESPENFAISIEKDARHSKYLTQKNIEAGNFLQPGATLRLKKSAAKEVEELIEALQKKELPLVQKKAVFDLCKTYLQDKEFVKEFLNKGGVSFIIDLIKRSTAGTLAHGLHALEIVMGSGYGYESIGEDIMHRIVELVHDSTNILVKSNALKICAHLIGNEKTAGFWFIHHQIVVTAKKRNQDPYEVIVFGLKNEDLNIKVGALQVINSFIEHAPDGPTFEEFLSLIQKFGYLEELKIQLDIVKSSDFKEAVLLHQIKKANRWVLEKDIGYDKNNPRHESLLMELWNTCFPETELTNRVSDQWKCLGFQGQDPATDFRGMGLLGLKHILYFAKNYTKVYVEMAQTQAARESFYYPVSTAGIHISAMLLEILKVGAPIHESQVSPILFDHHHSLEEMYCLVFRLFHRVWDEKHADYMDFKAVADEVKEMTINALENSSDLKMFAQFLRVPEVPSNTKNQLHPVSLLLDLNAIEQKIMKGNKRSARKSVAVGAHPKLIFSEPSKKRTMVPGADPVPTPAGPSQFVSDTVSLDVYVPSANQSLQQTVSREMTAKSLIDQTCRALKKKMKKPKKGESQHLYLPSTRIWLNDSRKIWSYLLKDKERLELKSRTNVQLRKVEIAINLESGKTTQTIEYLPESSVKGVIQMIDKQKTIVRDIQDYGLFMEGSGRHIWLDESRTLSSYGLSNCKLIFSLRSAVIGGNVTKKQPIVLQIQAENTIKKMQFDENNTAAEILNRVCSRMSLDSSQHCLFFSERSKYMALELPIASYAVMPSQVLILKQKPPNWLPDPPIVEMLGLSVNQSSFRRDSTSGQEGSEKEFEKWSADNVCEWVRGLRMEEYESCFRSGDGVDGKVLKRITVLELKELGIPPLGVRKEIVRQVKLLK